MNTDQVPDLVCSNSICWFLRTRPRKSKSRPNRMSWASQLLVAVQSPCRFFPQSHWTDKRRNCIGFIETFEIHRTGGTMHVWWITIPAVYKIRSCDNKCIFQYLYEFQVLPYFAYAVKFLSRNYSFCCISSVLIPISSFRRKMNPIDSMV